MSLERYVANHNIRNEVEAQRKPSQSPIRVLADMMIEDAVTELVSIDRGGNSPMRSALTADRPTNSKNMGRYRKNVEAMIYLGNIIIAMEDTVIDGQYDHKAFCDSVNQSIGTYAKFSEDFIGEPLEPKELPTEAKKKKDKKEKEIEARNITRVIDNDPTFSPFIEFPDALLPGPLLQVLEEQRMKSRIQRMARNYKKISGKLVRKDSIYSFREIQEITLSMFDSFIDNIGRSDAPPVDINT